MKRLWVFALLIFIMGCGGYSPEKGRITLQVRENMQIPLRSFPRVSLALSPSGDIYMVKPDKEVVRLDRSGKEETVLKADLFTYFPSLYFVGHCLWATTPREVVKFCPGNVAAKGELGRFYNRVVPTKSGRLLGDYMSIPQGKKPFRRLILIKDGENPEMKILESYKIGALIIKSPRGLSAITIPEVVPSLIWSYSRKTDHIIAAESDTYRIKVIDLKGRVLKTIGFRVKPPEFPMERRLEIAPKLIFWRPANRQQTIETIARGLPSHLPVLRRILPLPSGLFLVEVNDAVGKSHFDVLNEKGKYLYRFSLPHGFYLVSVLSNGWLVMKRKGEVGIYTCLNLSSVFQPGSSL